MSIKKSQLEKEMAAMDSKKEQLEKEMAEMDSKKEQLANIVTEMATKKEQLEQQMAELAAKEIESNQKQEKKRAAEIIGVFANHNFYANGFTPIELRTTLEDLGPTYVKIGQIMSSRVDLLPESYCEELGKLRSNVKELDPAVAREVIEQETGKTIDELFLEFQDKPLGSASIGQVHRAVLKDGTPVITKVQRPMIADMMRKDFVLLKKLAGLVNMRKDENSGSTIDLVSVIEEFEKVTEEELDFRVEAENTRIFKEKCIPEPDKIDCPTIISELTTERLFTETCVDGYSISHKERMIEDGYVPLEVGHAIVENYLYQVLDVGIFHADPHQGNIMIADGKPYWIDFGMMGRISDSDVNTIQTMVLSLLGGDLEELINGVMALGAASPKTSRTKLVDDLEGLMSKYTGVTSISDVDTAGLFEEISDICSNNFITLPGRYTMLVRSLATIEGVIEELCPELNLFELFSTKMKERAKKNFDAKQAAISFGTEALTTAKKAAKIPGLTADALTNLIKGRTKVNMELTGYEELTDKVDSITRNLILTIFSGILFFGSCILCTADIQPKTPQNIPILAMVGFVISIALGIYIVKNLPKKKK